jgi:hypothetical protein
MNRKRRTPSDPTRRNPSPLRGDHRRQAVAVIEGYHYQIWSSVAAWLRLTEQDVLFLERAEDFDIASPSTTIAVQTKSLSRAITLNDKAVVEGLNNFQAHRERNPGRQVHYRFLTTAHIGKERKPPFPGGIAGLSAWQDAIGRADHRATLRRFLLHSRRLAPSLKAFLRDADGDALNRELFSRVRWETAHEGVPGVKRAVEELLIYLGEARNIPPSKSESVAPALYQEVMDCIVNTDQRRLTRADLLKAFEDATTTQVPTHQLAQVVSLQAAALALTLPTSSDDMRILSTEGSPPWPQPPPLPRECIPRTAIVGEVEEKLNRYSVVEITAAMGMGKSTLAKLVAASTARSWAWLNCPTEPGVSNRHFMLLAAMVRASSADRPLNVVIDGTDQVKWGPSEQAEFFGALTHFTCRQGGWLLITGRRRLAARIRRELEFADDSTVLVPALDREEIAALCDASGCHDATLRTAWAGIIELQTNGHPQLVHARALALASQGWPPVRTAEIFTVPEDVSEERLYARRILQDTATEYERELLFRLSLYSGEFRRDHALALAEFDPVIRLPGEAFDRLVGPWLEQTREDRFRVLALLKSAATDIWTVDRVRLLNQQIAIAILKCGRLSNLEVGSCMLHSLAGGAGIEFATVVSAILDAAPEIRGHLLRDLDWVAFVSDLPSGAPAATISFIRYLLRRLQFEIALAGGKGNAEDIARRWDDEHASHEPEEAFFVERYLLSIRLLIAVAVRIPPRRLVGYLDCVLRSLDRFHAESGFERVGQFPTTTSVLGAEVHAVVALTVCTLARKCNAAGLIEFLDAIATASDRVRALVLEAFEEFDTSLGLFLSNCWLEESKTEAPNWDACMDALSVAGRYGESWGCESLRIHAACAIAVIEDEYLGRPDAAIARLTAEGTEQPRLSDALTEGLAMVQFRRSEYEAALAHFRVLLTRWETPESRRDTSILFPVHRAGVCAAQLLRWAEAGGLFLSGARLSEASGRLLDASALFADAAHAEWRSGESHACVESCASALTQLVANQVAEDQRSRAIRKKVGYLIQVLANAARGRPRASMPEPGVGWCSNFTNEEAVGMLLPTPIEFAYLAAAQLEHELNHRVGLLEAASSIVGDDGDPKVQYFLAELRVRRALKDQDFDRYLERAEGFQSSLARLHRAGNQASETTEEFPASPNGGSEFRLSESLLLSAAVAVMFGGNCLDVVNIGGWGRQAGVFGLGEAMIQAINDTLGLLDGHPAGALRLMVDGEADAGRRVVAAVRIASCDVLPHELYLAHLTIVLSSHVWPWSKEVGEAIEGRVAGQWMAWTGQSASLNSPRLTIPSIREACASAASGMKKCAEILRAARAAVSVRIPESVDETLIKIAQGEST